jgi:NADH-quinone oxidoreductase subunit H
MISYELPFIISLLTVGFITGFVVSPFLAWEFPFAFAAFLLSVMGILSISPFHVPDAEQEIVGGLFAEYSGPRLGMFLLAKDVMLWSLVSIGAILFLGGGPFEWFLAKSLALLLAVIAIRVALARLRIDQVFRLFWLVIGPLAMIDLIRAIFGIWV